MALALLVVSSDDRSLRLRRILDPLASVYTHTDASAVPVLAVTLQARLAVIDIDCVRAGPADQCRDRVSEAIRLIAHIHAAAPRLPLVLIAGCLSTDDELALFQAGLNALCPPNMDDAALGRSLGAALRGEVCMRRELASIMVRRSATPPIQAARWSARAAPQRHGGTLARLTPREYEIARAVGEGQSNKRTACALGITERTVKAHLTEIFRKLGIDDRVQLALLVARSALKARLQHEYPSVETRFGVETLAPLPGHAKGLLAT
jgi:DNA-binding NarL/FixJ family response regulator